MKSLLTITAVAATLTLGLDVTAAAVIPGPPITARGPYPKPEPVPVPKPQPNETGRWRGPCSDWWVGENLTQKMWNENPARGAQMMQRLIVCVFGTFAPGESVMALYVADRESHFYPWALNSSSGASGLFQHLASYWPGRAAAYLQRAWFGKGAWPPSAFDPRANAIAAAKMVAQSGWGPWSM